MICSKCHNELTCEKTVHHYKESGLNNIWLDGVDIYRCPCGEKIVGIPLIPKLHNLIGLKLVRKKSLLSAGEIRFLRKNTGLTPSEFARRTGLDETDIFGWEKSGADKAADLLFRSFYSDIKGIPFREIKHISEETFPEQYIIPVSEWYNSAYSETRVIPEADPCFAPAYT